MISLTMVSVIRPLIMGHHKSSIDPLPMYDGVVTLERFIKDHVDTWVGGI